MPEEPQEEIKEELSAEEVAAAEVTKAEEVTEEVKEKTWAELGLNERFDGMSRADIAGDILHRNTVHARQADEVGQLRKDLAARDEKLANITKAADLPVEVKAEVKKMSAQELERFLMDFQTDPDEAMDRRFGERFGRRSDKEIKELMSEVAQDVVSGYHGYTQEQTAMADPDYQSCAGYIKMLQDEEHFGNTRSTMELLELSRLVLTDKESADPVYEAMKRFPSVPMQECIHMVSGRPKATVDANKIRKQVKSIAGGGLPSGANKVSQTEAVDDMDDAFDADKINE